MRNLITIMAILLLTACNQPQQVTVSETPQSPIMEIQGRKGTLITRDAVWRGEIGGIKIARIKITDLENGDERTGVTFEVEGSNEQGFIDDSEIASFHNAIKHITTKTTKGQARRGVDAIYTTESGLMLGSSAALRLFTWTNFLRIHSSAPVKFLTNAQLDSISAHIKETYYFH